jgi:putative acetyltransferase
MITFIHTNFSNADFNKLIAELDHEIILRYPFLEGSTVPFNILNEEARVIVAYENTMPIACGAFRPVDATTIEIKRMYTIPSHRNQGIGKKILLELEKWARREEFGNAILETGINQPEAIAAYQKSGYVPMPNFAPYENIKESICMKKLLKS